MLNLRDLAEKHTALLLLYLVGLATIAGTTIAGSGTAMAAPASSAFMALGEAAPAPIAFLEFCTRRPQDCRSSRPDQAATARRSDPVSPDGSAQLIRTSAMHAPGSAAPAAELGSASAEPAGQFQPSDASDAPPRRSSALMAELERVNRRINEVIKPASDMVTHGVPDHWDLPLEEGETRGDCEDYVLEKQRTLINEGFPASALSIGVVRTHWGENHAVLIVTTDKGELVLDNLSPWVTPWRELNYQWIERQVPGQPMKWVGVAGSAATLSPVG